MDPPDFPSGRLFTINSEDEWNIYQDFLLGSNRKEYELVGKFCTATVLILSFFICATLV